MIIFLRLNRVTGSSALYLSRMTLFISFQSFTSFFGQRYSKMIYLLCDLLCCHLLYIPIEVIVLGCLQEVREAWLLVIGFNFICEAPVRGG